ncbi:MAG: BMC domain-containing protein [Lachnospiraceae bacterium]|nr:BMC domain-containing protein [Lachnospiraceae bacterium]
MEALGMIEVYGYLTAVEALDSACKAANVSLVDVVKVRGGLVSVLVTGDVGAVKAAIDASAAAAQRVGKIVSIHVIPRPAADVAKMLKRKPKEDPKPDPSPGPVSDSTPSHKSDENLKEEPKPAAEEETRKAAPENLQELLTEEPISQEEVPKPDIDPMQITIEQMREMTVSALRSLARQLKIDTMNRQEIRFAKKQELIHGILKFLGQEK